MTTEQVTDGGEAILQGCRDLGIEYIFSSPGSDWSSIWEALGRQQLLGRAGPTYFGCWHELLAVDLAAGYAEASGRISVVLLHAGVGVLHAAMALNGARSAELPMLVMSGESTSFGTGGAFDPGPQWYNNHNVAGGLCALVHPLFKWAHGINNVSILYESVLRAGQIAQASPVGPTYLDVPLETMVAPWSAPSRSRAIPPAPRLQPSPVDLNNVAAKLRAAKRPVVITGSVRSPDTYDALLDLADLLALPIFESPAGDVSSFPKENLLHAGFDPNPSLKEADLVLLVQNRTPWYPLAAGPERATVVSIDEIPLKLHMAHQDLRAEVVLSGDTRTSLQLLADALRPLVRIDGSLRAAIEIRRERHACAHKQASQHRIARIAQARADSRINPVMLCAALNDTLSQDTIYVDETTCHLGVNRRYLNYYGPQSYIAMRWGLGQGIGVALGVKLARRDRLVTCLVGDGAFLYNPMIACFGTARDAQLPLLIVIYNNRGYRAMRDSQLAYYPEGVGAKGNLYYGSPISGIEYEALVRPFGGFGVRVETPAALAPALEQARRAVLDGKTAVVNVLLNDAE